MPHQQLEKTHVLLLLQLVIHSPLVGYALDTIREELLLRTITRWPCAIYGVPGTSSHVTMTMLRGERATVSNRCACVQRGHDVSARFEMVSST